MTQRTSNQENSSSASKEELLCRCGALPHPHFHFGSPLVASPQRFSVLYGVGREFPHFRSCHDGGWIYYGDYESLRAELDRQRAEIERLRSEPHCPTCGGERGPT